MDITDSRFQFGHYELDSGTFKLLKDGEALPLEPKGIDLLRLLLERAPRVVEKSEIFSFSGRTSRSPTTR